MRLETPQWPFGERCDGVRWRQDRGLTRLPRRWARADDWWEAPEPFSGAAALADLRGSARDPERAKRVVARYVVLRFVIQAADDPPSNALLTAERMTARGYLDGASTRGERRALECALREAAHPRSPALYRALCRAAAAAAREGHRGGASAFYQTGYRLALAAGCLAEAAAAAAAIAALVAGGDTGRSDRLWRRRARVLSRAAGNRSGRGPHMGGGYTAEQRRSLAAAISRGEAPACPVCGGTLVQRPVARPPDLSYVRRRVWAICARCKRSAAVDVRSEEG